MPTVPEDVTVRELTVYLPTSYYTRDAWSLRLQFHCLAQQTVRDFDVVLLDPHYRKRWGTVRELADIYGLTVTHYPYECNQNVSKFHDWTMLNSAFAMIEAKRLLRMSCYRVFKPNMVELVLNTPAPHNIDFGYCPIAANHRAVRPDATVDFDLLPPKAARLHPRHSRYVSGTDQQEVIGPMPPEGQTEATTLVTLQCFGNGAWWREQWLRVNGICEAFTAGTTCEDIEYDVRAAADGQTVTYRDDCPMYRLEHGKGPSLCYASPIPPDRALRPPCEQCYQMARDRSHLTKRLSRGDFERFDDLGLIVCRDCHLADGNWLTSGEDFYKVLARSGRTQAAILPQYNIGRNLRILASDMAGQSWSRKIELLEASWDHPRYYAP